VDPSTAASFAPPSGDCAGKPAALVVLGPSATSFGASAASSAAELEQAMHAIEQVGQRPVLLGPSRSSVSLPGITPRQVVSLHTSGDAEVLTGAPAGNWPVTYSLWLARTAQHRHLVPGFLDLPWTLR